MKTMLFFVRRVWCHLFHKLFHINVGIAEHKWTAYKCEKCGLTWYDYPTFFIKTAGGRYICEK